MGVPVHQVKEFSPRLSFGCSISGVPYLSLAMLDHPEHAREVRRRLAADGDLLRHDRRRQRQRPPGAGLPRSAGAVTRSATPDMRDLADGTRKLCELLFAAGAETLYPTVDGAAPLHGIDDLLRVADPLPQGRTSLMTIHLFSTCPMGEDKRALRAGFLRPRARPRRPLHRRRQPPVHGARGQPAGLGDGFRPPQRAAFPGPAMTPSRSCHVHTPPVIPAERCEPERRAALRSGTS